MKQHYHTIDMIAIILLLVGGVNWGFVGLLDFDVIGAIVGMVLARIVFVLIGISALWYIFCWFQKKSSAR
jgi:uncharacterized membrane protein YuzA (DUF378 family)